VTLHQGAIESIFLDSMKAVGVVVERPIEPTSLTISEDEKVLKDPKAHAVRVTIIVHFFEGWT
jgi:phenol 2-monooxygenase (NADPH)